MDVNALDVSAMDELTRFRNTVLAVAVVAIAFWIMNDWIRTLDVLVDPSIWLLSLLARETM